MSRYVHWKNPTATSHASAGNGSTPEVMTLVEAARFLRVSERTLGQLAKDQRAPHTRVGNQFRFSRAQLLAWLENGGTQ